MALVLDVRDVHRIYESAAGFTHALRGVSLQVKRGEFLCVMGPSGSGKSTLMNIIGCLDEPDEGEYYLDGQEIRSYHEDELARIRNRKIGFIFQNFNLIGRMSAWDNVELPLVYQHMPARERRQRVSSALERVGLLQRSGHLPTELSGGQQQRVAIARAIAVQPPLFLADEPTGNLDSHTGAEIMRLFRELHDAGHTIVLITHDPSVAAQADRRIHISDGIVTEVD